MYRRRSFNRFTLFIAMVLIAAAAGCSVDPTQIDEDSENCRDEFSAPDGQRPVCEYF